ncbi:MAG TPA: hypothetical protein VF624_01355 [Tepidisphaeraceae bacterium]|jgi:hypothetical protein
MNTLTLPRGTGRRAGATAGLRAEWRRLARVLADPAVELDADTFGDVLACYSRLQAAGVRVDPMAEALIRQGCYELVCSIEAMGGGEADPARMRRIIEARARLA